MNIDYKEYLNSEEWKKVREDKLTRGTYCSICNKEKVDIHHLTYENLGNEKITDLVRLCRECHFTLHRLFKEGKVKFKRKSISLTELRKRSYHSQLTLIKIAIKKARNFGYWNERNHFVPFNMFNGKEKEAPKISRLF